MEASAPDPEDDGSVSIGGFSPHDSRRLFAALAVAHIEFRAEFFDGITPGTIGFGDGNNARINVRVDREKLEEVKRIQSDLFGDVFEPEA